MKNNNIQGDSLSELREGLKSLKGSLNSGVISDREIRQAMKSKSSWLGKVVVSEFIVLPLIILFLFGMAHSTGMSIWLPITFAVCAIPDAVLDIRTLAISKKWIQSDTIHTLIQKLIRQKKERQYQTIIGSVLVCPWVIWFIYEYIKCDSMMKTIISSDSFGWVWGIISVVALLVAESIIVIIYRKAQATNLEMIKQLGSFDECQVYQP
jgi:hypothetical protein